MKYQTLHYALMVCLLGSLGAAQAGTLRLDGFDYNLDLTVAPSWDYETKTLQLGTTAAMNCLRADGSAPTSTGPVTARFAGGAQTFYSDNLIELSSTVPNVWMQSVDGDLLCSGAALAPLFSNQFE